MGVRGCCHDIPYSISIRRILHFTYSILALHILLGMAHTPWPENAEWWQRSLLFSPVCLGRPPRQPPPSTTSTPPIINMRVIDRCCTFFANTRTGARDACV